MLVWAGVLQLLTEHSGVNHGKLFVHVHENSRVIPGSSRKAVRAPTVDRDS